MYLYICKRYNRIMQGGTAVIKNDITENKYDISKLASFPSLYLNMQFIRKKGSESNAFYIF